MCIDDSFGRTVCGFSFPVDLVILAMLVPRSQVSWPSCECPSLVRVAVAMALVTRVVGAETLL